MSITNSKRARVVFGVGLVTLVAVGMSSGKHDAFSTSSAPVTTSMSECADEDGEVWVAWDVPMTCDVTRFQILTLTGVPDESTCDELGGEWYGGGVCHQVDF